MIAVHPHYIHHRTALRVLDGVVGPTANQPRGLDTCGGAICSPGVVDTRAPALGALRSRTRAARLTSRRLRVTEKDTHNWRRCPEQK